MRARFTEAMDELERDLLATGDLVQEQLARVLRALVERDESLLEEIIEGDDEVDAGYVKVELEILNTLALQAPVASDLRLVSAVLHVNMHLERMGDLCENMAKTIRAALDFTPNERILNMLMEEGAIARRMIAASLQAFSRRDVELARNLPDLDDPIDRLNRGIWDAIKSQGTDESYLDWANKMVMVSRYLERMGDHAVDIGEQVTFVVTGNLEV
jgi:phosphate transport system protein